MSKARITDKKLKRAAELARESGVRVKIGDFVFEPPAANDEKLAEDDDIQAKIDAMGRR